MYKHRRSFNILLPEIQNKHPEVLKRERIEDLNNLLKFWLSKYIIACVQCRK